ncbi:MAG: hypothetical protein K2Y01_06955 [Rhabdochlamydiaceae bacterium]|nr:hypothetical protein [Rhabdochlamydiaceae bacterium]
MHVSTPKKTGLGYESALETFSRITSNTSSLKRFLRIVYKALKFHSEIHLLMGGIANSGTSKLALQLRESVEILTTAHSVNLVQELTCPNKKGVYFFYRASWQRCASRIFFLFYSFLHHVQLAEKFQFIDLGKISKIAIGQLPIFKFVAGSMSALSSACAVGEGIRVKEWFKIITSIGKIFVIVLTLALEALSIQRTFYILLLTGTSCSIDIFCLAKNEKLI